MPSEDYDAEPEAVASHELLFPDEYKCTRVRGLLDTMNDDNRTESEQDLALQLGFTLAQAKQLNEDGRSNFRS